MKTCGQCAHWKSALVGIRDWGVCGAPPVIKTGWGHCLAPVPTWIKLGVPHWLRYEAPQINAADDTAIDCDAFEGREDAVQDLRSV